MVKVGMCHLINFFFFYVKGNKSIFCIINTILVYLSLVGFTTCNKRFPSFVIKYSLMYWSDWGTSHKIEVASMDGNNRSTLVKRGLYWPNGLTLDGANNKLYWVDAWFHMLEYYDLQRHTITSLFRDRYVLSNPFGLTLLEDKIYWTDSSSGVVYQSPKDSPSNATVLVSGLSQPLDIHAYDRNQTFPGIS